MCVVHSKWTMLSKGKIGLKLKNKSVANHSAMTWAKSIKWVNLPKGKAGDGSWKSEG